MSPGRCHRTALFLVLLPPAGGCGFLSYGPRSRAGTGAASTYRCSRRTTTSCRSGQRHGLYRLAPGPMPEEIDPAYYRARLRVLTPEQFAVLADFIELVAGDERLCEAYEDLEVGQANLHHYWQTRWQ